MSFSGDAIIGPDLDKPAQDRLPWGLIPRGTGRPKLNPGLEAIPRSMFKGVLLAGEPGTALAAPASVLLSGSSPVSRSAPAVTAPWSLQAGGLMRLLPPLHLPAILHVHSITPCCPRFRPTLDQP